MAEDPRYSETARKILSRIEQGEVAATSTLIINQVVSYLRWKKAAASIPRFLEFLQSLPSLSKAETTFADYIEAKKRSDEKWSLFDDYVIAHQMERLNLTEIYSNDSDFDNLEHIKRIFE
jgi:predicted nucleic acid-binding protein